MAGAPAEIPELSVVVPVLDNAACIRENLLELATYLGWQSYAAEIIVVDDGSTDGTAALAEVVTAQAAVPLRVLRHSTNLGKGAAVRTGMREARGRYRVFIDSDLAYPPSEINNVLEKLRAGYDVAVASRLHPESWYRVRPAFFRYLYTRHIAGRVFNWLVQQLLLPGLSDTQAGLKGFTAASADALFSEWLPDRFGFDLGVLARARRLGLRIAEVGVRFRYDSEPTTLRFFADTVAMLRDMLAVRLRIGYAPEPAPTGTALEGQAHAPAAAVAPGPAVIGRLKPWHAAVGACGLLLGVEAARQAHAPLWVPLALWMAALGLWFASGFTWDRVHAVRPIRAFASHGEAVALLGITALAAVLRLVALSDIPAFIHHDAAACGLVGRELLTGVQRDPFALSPWWYYFPHLGLLPYTLSFKLFGVSVLSLRLATAVPGILAVPALYFLVRGWFGRPTATIAALLLSTNHVAVHFSRVGIWNIHSMLLELVGFAALFVGMRRHSAFWLAMAGVVSGLGLYTYTAGRLVFGLAVLAFVGYVLHLPRPRNLRPAGFFLVALAITVAPLVGSYARRPEALKADRIGTVDAFAASNRDHVTDAVGSSKWPAILAYQVRHTLGGFVSEGDTSSHYSIGRPLIGHVTLVLALGGLLLALRHLGSGSYLFLLLWLGCGLFFGSVLTVDPPFFPRLLVTLPVLHILAAVFLGRIWAHSLLWTKGPRTIAVVAVAALAVVSMVTSTRRYVAWCRQVGPEINEWDVLRELQRLPRDASVYFFTGPYMMADSYTFTLFQEKRRLLFGITATDIPERLNGRSAFILTPEFRDLGLVLTRRFPSLDRQVVNAGGVRQLIVYRWDPPTGQPRQERSR